MDVAEIIKSNVPLDWVTLTQFAKLIGLPPSRLYQAKDKWPEGVVWQRLNNKLYFSLRGFNKWLDNQSIQKALECEAIACKSTSQLIECANTSPSRNHRHQKASPKRVNYELT